MIKRDFSVWDFVKQEPKKETIDITGGTLISDYPNVIVGNGDWTTTTTAIGGNNIILGGNNLTVSDDINNTVFVQNLSVAGTTDIPPREGDMRTVMDEDGYWATQVFNTPLNATTPNNPNGEEWVTISRTDSMITVDGFSTRPKRHITWTGHFFNKFKTWLKKITTRPYRGHYEI